MKNLNAEFLGRIGDFGPRLVVLRILLVARLGKAKQWIEHE
jgi:hypothetical protein